MLGFRTELGSGGGMGGGTADDCPTGVIPLLETIHDHRHTQMASLPIPDDILAEILLQLPTPADLARASAACVSFRRIAADRSFVRRFRKLHAPPLLGFLEQSKVFHPVTSPHPCASAAKAVALAADFSFSFLPAPASDWVLRDIRDGHVLLDRAPQHGIHRRYMVVFREMVVCNPLHQRYILLLPIDNLAATPERLHWTTEHGYCETFLAPSREEDETSFGVIWMAQCETRLAAFVFSSSTAQWRSIPSESRSDIDGLLEWSLFSRRLYAYGCFFWVTGWSEWLLVLDTQIMEFSIAETPPEARGLDLSGGAIAIVEAGEGRVGMFVRPHSANYLNYIIRRNSCASASQWQFEKTISLDSGYSFMFSTGKHLFLYQRQSWLLDASRFSLDVKTFQLERVFGWNSRTPLMYAYSNFPTSLLWTPTISSGPEKGIEKEMLEQGCAASSKAQSSRSE